MAFEALLVNATGMVVCLSLMLFAALRARDWLNPVLAFSVPWATNILASQFILGSGQSPRIETLVVLYLTWSVFLLAPCLISYTTPRAMRPAETPIVRHRAVLALFILVSLQATSVLYEWAHMGLFDGGITQAFAVYPLLRVSGILRDVDLPWYLEIWRWGFTYYIPLAVLMLSRKMLSWQAFILVSGVALISASSKYSRLPILQLLILFFVSWIIYFRPPPRRVASTIFLTAVIAVSAFLLMEHALFTRATYAVHFDYTERLAAYVGGPAKAYELLLKGKVPKEDGVYSLEAVNYILHKLTFLRSYPGIQRPYIVYGPLTTNVYTFLDSYTLDLGSTGAVLGSFLSGLATAVAYCNAKKRCTVSAVAVFSFLLFASVVAWMVNMYIRVTVWLILLVGFLTSKWIAATKLSSPVEGRDLQCQ